MLTVYVLLTFSTQKVNNASFRGFQDLIKIIDSGPIIINHLLQQMEIDYLIICVHVNFLACQGESVLYIVKPSQVQKHLPAT